MFRKIQSRESVAVEEGRWAFSLRNIMRYAAIGLLVICAGLGGHLADRYSRSVGVEKDYLVFAAKDRKRALSYRMVQGLAELRLRNQVHKPIWRLRTHHILGWRLILR